MSSVNVLDRDGQELVQTVELPDAVFGVALNVPLIHQVVVAQLAAARQGTKKAKTRGEVRGGGKKPYRQKGTGRARQGSIRAPQFVGGGTVHGPQPQDFTQKTPKKMKAAALRGALSDRARGGKVRVVQGFVPGDVPSTKQALASLLAVSAARSVLVVTDRADTVAWRSLRNVEHVHLIAPDQLNTYDVLCADEIVFTEGALAAFLAGPPSGKSRTARARSGEVTDGEPTAADLGDAVEVLGGTGVRTRTADVSPTPSGGTVSETSGTSTTAGEGVSDAELVQQVAGQTSSDLEVEGAFERESDGAATETEAAKASGDELDGDAP